MKRLTTVLLVASAGLLAACTTDPAAATRHDGSATVTRTVTKSASSPEPSPEQGAEPAVDPDPLPCDAVHVEAAMAEGEAPTPEVWDTAIVVTNLGPDACQLDGTSELELFTGGDGRRLDVKEITSDDGVPADLVILDVGDQASMAVSYPTTAEAPATRPDCAQGGSFAHVTLPGDKEAVEAWPEDKQLGLPPVCGPVTVTSWYSGGAPGVAPN
ncbi:MAG TPA: DUF4232 domain-containing protein [Actinophytocola sp.]|nr:DUF4232 domain-containing protein [Actinophytocola sp.]